MEEFAYVLEIDYLCSGIQGPSTGPRVYTQKKCTIFTDSTL